MLQRSVKARAGTGAEGTSGRPSMLTLAASQSIASDLPRTNGRAVGDAPVVERGQHGIERKV